MNVCFRARFALLALLVLAPSTWALEISFGYAFSFSHFGETISGSFGGKFTPESRFIQPSTLLWIDLKLPDFTYTLANTGLEVSFASVVILKWHYKVA